MIVVIIAGGAGTRLWPLSTSTYPKHLLKVIDHRSLLQNTFDRVQKITSTNKILVVSEESHIEHIYKQLDELDKDNILVEPARRGTASCIALALCEIKKRKFDKDEPILFIWADSLIRDNNGFVATALKSGDIATEHKTIVFIGAEPTYPSTGFGYMHKGKMVNGWRDVYELSGFVEKPDRKTAKEYLTSGEYLWNVGYLVGELKTFEDYFERYAPDMKDRYQKLCTSKDIEKTYLALESVAVEYVFSEKIKGALVIPGTFDWMDIGSFHDLHSVSLLDDGGNHVRGENIVVEETTNSYIHNEEDTPVAVVGLDNLVVINSPNGVLVVNKNYAQKVGDIAKKIQN